MSLYCFSFEQYSDLMSALYGSLCIRFDYCLSCFLNALQSMSNHFYFFGIFFLVYFLPSIHLDVLLF